MGTITKAIELLELFSRARPEIGLGEFVRLTGRDKATLHRHLTELAQNGLLEQCHDTRAYRLGPAILRLSAVREATHPFRAVIRPIVSQLAEEAGELAHASLLQGPMLTPVFHADPKRHGTQVHFDEAEMLPLHATSSGLAVLAYAPQSLLDEVLATGLPPMATGTITDAATLRHLIDTTRRTGISQLSKAFDDEVTSQGAPLFGPNAEVIGAISVAVPTSRVDADKLDALLPPLRRAALAATNSLGGTLPRMLTGLWADAQDTHQPQSRTA